PERDTLAQAGEHLDFVGLDLLARTSAVALLAAPEVVVDRVAVEPEAGRETGDDGDERRTVRFARGGEAQGHAGSLCTKGGAHDGGGRGQAGPAFEGRCALPEQDVEAVDDDRATGRPRRGDERGLAAVRPVGEVDDLLARSRPDRQLVAERGRVEQE